MGSPLSPRLLTLHSSLEQTVQCKIRDLLSVVGASSRIEPLVWFSPRLLTSHSPFEQIVHRRIQDLFFVVGVTSQMEPLMFVVEAGCEGRRSVGRWGWAMHAGSDVHNTYCFVGIEVRVTGISAQPLPSIVSVPKVF